MDAAALNWMEIATGTVFGQIFLTVWFLVLFGDPWAREYGVEDKAAHSKAVPGYTYGIGLACTAALTIGLALAQQAMGIESIGGGLALGLAVALCFSLATALPGYAFLLRWRAFRLAMGAQALLILALSVLLAAWS